MESEGNKDVNRYRFKYRFKDSTIFIIHEMTKINGLASEDSKCSAFLTLNSQKFLLQKHSMSSEFNTSGYSVNPMSTCKVWSL